MLLELDAPLIWLDVETTGAHKKVDRIVQIGLTKLYPDGKVSPWSTYVNPTIPIPPEVQEIHHITDEMVKDAPIFKTLAPKLATGFKGCDFGGFSVWFDLDFLDAEFVRAGLTDIINGRVLDSQAIYRKFHPRTLTDAVKEYLSEELPGAHDAAVDSDAAMRLFEAQLARHIELPRNVNDLNRMFFETPDPSHVDADGKFYWRNNEACINFGEHAGTPLREMPRGYLRWMLDKDFPLDTKRIVKASLDGVHPVRVKPS